MENIISPLWLPAIPAVLVFQQGMEPLWFLCVAGKTQGWGKSPGFEASPRAGGGGDGTLIGEEEGFEVCDSHQCCGNPPEICHRSPMGRGLVLGLGWALTTLTAPARGFSADLFGRGLTHSRKGDFRLQPSPNHGLCG